MTIGMNWRLNNPAFFCLLAIVLLATVPASAQQGERGEMLEQLRIARLTEALELSVEEGQQFWPLYNTYRKDLKRVIQAEKEVFRGLEDEEDLSEARFKAAVAERRTLANEREQLSESFLYDVMALLGPKRTLTMLTTEEGFRREVVRELRDRRKGGR